MAKKHIHIRLHAYIQYLKLLIGTLIIFSMLILGLRFFIFSPGIVNGPSMEPHFMDEDFFWVNKFRYFFSEPKRFDVVQIINVKDDKIIIKRVIGLPGETIIIKRGKVYVQKSAGEPEVKVEEPYLSPEIYTTIMGQHAPLVFAVPIGQYFVLGDNRPDSTDSRYFGSLNRRFIIGQVIGAGRK